MAKSEKEAQEKLMQMQLLQQRIQVFAGQKQQFQLQQIELDNAIKELAKSKKSVYSLVGEIMIERPIATVNKELQEKKNEVDIRIKNIEKQEKKTKEEADELQKYLTKSLK